MKIGQLTLENFIPLWLTGPIFDKELRVCSRRKRYYWLRGMHLAMMAVLILITWLTTSATFGLQGNAYSASRMAGVGRMVIISIVWFQFFISQVAAILFFSNSICEEMNQGTLNVLMSTPITSLQIVMGKLLSRLVQLVLILCLSLSTLAIVYVFGGIHWDYIISTFFVTLTAVLFMGTLTLFLSSTVKRPYSVIVLMLTFMCMYYMIGSYIGQTVSGTAGQWITMLNPLTAMIEITSPNVFAATGFTWPFHCLAMVGVSALLVMGTIVRLRKTMLTFAFEKNVKSKGAIGRAKRFLVGSSSGYPITLKGLPKSGRKNLLMVIPILVFVSVWAFLIYFAFSSDGSMSSNSVLMMSISTLSTLLWLIVYIKTLMSASTAITNEKENRTLIALLSTPLENSQIINGKILNICKQNRFGWALLLANNFLQMMCMMTLINPATNATGNPLGEVFGPFIQTLVSMLGIVGSLFFVICFGLYISVRVKNNMVALVVVLAGLLVWGFIKNLIIIIPIIISQFIFSGFGFLPMMIAPIILNVAIGLIFLWRAKKSLRHYALAR